MVEQSSRRLAIIGAGPTGYTLAMTLALKGYQVDVFEKREDPLIAIEKNEWRSLFIGVHARINKAWEKIGVLEEMLSQGQPFKNMKMHNYDGATFKFSFCAPDECIYSLKRQWILNVLARKVKEHSNVTVHYNTQVANVDLKKGSFDVTFSDGKTENKTEYDWVFGADGTYSAVLAAMKQSFDFSYSQEYCDYGFFEVAYKVGEDGKCPLEADCLHHFLSHDKGNLLFTVVNKDGSCNFAVMQKVRGENSYESFRGRFEEYGPFIRSCHYDAKDAFYPDAQQLENQRLSRPVTSKAGPWTMGKFTILGDAAHSMNPFGGLGMNFNIQECQVIDENETLYPGDWRTITQNLEQTMKPQVDAAAEFSLQGFYTRAQGYFQNSRAQKAMILDSYIAKCYHDVFDNMMRRIFLKPEVPFHFAMATGMMQMMMLLELEKEVPDFYELMREGKRDERVVAILKKWQERQPGPGKPPMLPPGPNFGDPNVLYLKFLDTYEPPKEKPQ